MPCETTFDDAGHLVSIKCSRGPIEHHCSVCGRTSNRLCDFKVERPGTGLAEGQMFRATCDQPLCGQCAVKRGGLDYCPSHP